MARNKSNQLTDGEQSIMEVLWESGEASVRDITDELSKEKKPLIPQYKRYVRSLLKKATPTLEKKEKRLFTHQRLLKKKRGKVH